MSKLPATDLPVASVSTENVPAELLQRPLSSIGERKQEEGILQWLLGTIRMATNLGVQQWALKNGYIISPEETRENIYDLLQGREKFIQLQKLFISAKSEPDKLLKLIDGVFYIFGKEPSAIPYRDKVSLLLQNVYPFAPFILQFLGEENFDALFGRVGASSILAKGIMEAFFNYGIDGEKAFELAENFLKEAERNPNISKGFNNVEIGKIILSATRAGLLSPAFTQETFNKQLAGLLSIASAVRDQQALSGKSFEPEKFSDFLMAISTEYTGLPPDEVAKRIRMDMYILSKAPGGVFQAAALSSGVSPTIPVQEYTKDDIQLLNNAISSPFGNIVGATIRAVEEMGIGGPLLQLYNDIKSGNVSRILPQQWIDLAEASGLSRQHAVLLLRGGSRNRAYLAKDPVVLRTIRKAQYEYDILPQLERLAAISDNPEVFRGLVSDFAERLGYRQMGAMDAGEYMLFMMNPMINENARRVMLEAKLVADRKEAEAHVGQVRGTLRRVVDVLRSRPNIPKELQEPFVPSLVKSIWNVHNPIELPGSEFMKFPSAKLPEGIRPLKLPSPKDAFSVDFLKGEDYAIR